MNPTIPVCCGNDTGVVVAGQNITQTTGIGIAAGAVIGAMVGGKKHRIIGTLLGAIGGFFAGKKLDNPNS